jgi:hypothetical protein
LKFPLEESDTTTELVENSASTRRECLKLPLNENQDEMHAAILKYHFTDSFITIYPQDACLEKVGSSEGPSTEITRRTIT